MEIQGVKGFARLTIRSIEPLQNGGPFMSRKGLLIKRTNIVASGAGYTAAALRMRLEAHYQLADLFAREAPDAINWLEERGGFCAHPFYSVDELDRWGLPTMYDHLLVIDTDSLETAMLFKLTFGGR
jgi:hypothetical protein